MTAETIDKAKWELGPWHAEPDHKEWKDAATGLPCIAHRNIYMGFWCGYVAVPPGHPAHGKHYDDVDVLVHGGLTYAEACRGSVCHVPPPGEPDNVWWLGFDCGHAWDHAPGMSHRTGQHDPEETYRNLAYVEAECARLAQQLVSLPTGWAPKGKTMSILDEIRQAQTEAGERVVMENLRKRGLLGEPKADDKLRERESMKRAMRKHNRKYPLPVTFE